ncbi:hypothetical protein PCHCB_000161900 [Plasmodium chabaudi chabaudi]|uniref:Uncharacterized protein n=1 Tax=Plasmodium chabaudi chabaudi TaxID=31271 RepID=A0A1D3RTR8_PLACU|nr:hypothetical protein PCHCB_000161900 [Plasmodium chabaudi chabaudi]
MRILYFNSFISISFGDSSLSFFSKNIFKKVEQAGNVGNAGNAENAENVENVENVENAEKFIAIKIWQIFNYVVINPHSI